MKKNLIAFILVLFFILFSSSVFAAECSPAGQCGAAGGCLPGQLCTNYINTDEPNSCEWDIQNCPLSPTPCSTSSVSPCQNKNLFDSCAESSICTLESFSSFDKKCVCTFIPTPTPSSTPTPKPSSTPAPTPTIEPLPTPETAEVCPNNGTIYPPNSVCYSKVKLNEVERLGINLFDSNGSFLTYPLSCIPGPTITYKETFIGQDPAPNGITINRNVTINTDLSQVTLGFLGPDSNTLSTSNPDTLAKKYLFNALFDRPGTDPKAQRESFRTYWRMLNNTSQAKLKAYYLEKSNPNNTYYYVDKNKKQQKIILKDLKNDLPHCLKSYSPNSNCWTKNKYVDEYQDLIKSKPLVADAYDALLPFDFDNMRAYLANGEKISEENIPYLRAILTGLKGYRSDIPTPIFIPGYGFVKIPKTEIPGLFDYYTPDWALRPLALYPKYDGLFTGLENDLQKLIIDLIASLNKYCSPPSSTSSVSSPKTYPSVTNLSYTEAVPVTSHLVSSTPDKCYCEYGNTLCYQYGDCSDVSNCNYPCVFEKGEDTYELTGSVTGMPITVFNNPYITSLSDVVLGGTKLISNTSDSKLDQTIIDLINKLTDKLISPVQPSFYKMLLPDFASNSATPKSTVRAPSIQNSGTPEVTTATVTVNGGDSVYRENNLAQDTMHLLQNCWLVPSDQQTSSKCGGKKPIGKCALSEEPLTGICSKASFAEYAAGQSTPINSYIPLVPPELSAVYAEAEKVTGVSCVILAAIHYREGGNGLCTSLISGRKIGDPEPDNGGAVYSTLLETAIAAGNEFLGKYSFAQGKLGSGATKFQLLTLAFSYYNGGGNSNCLSDPPSSLYGQCPPLFKGEDDPYPLNFFDQRHANMYLRCLRDHDCSSSVPDQRPGVYTAALNYYNSLP